MQNIQGIYHHPTERVVEKDEPMNWEMKSVKSFVIKRKKPNLSEYKNQATGSL